MKLKKLESFVLEVLEENKKARGDDFLLYGMVLKKMRIPLTMPLKNFFSIAKDMGAPPFESVSRCRRHIQELRLDLVVPKIAVKRQIKEEDYKNYNYSGIGMEF